MFFSKFNKKEICLILLTMNLLSACTDSTPPFAGVKIGNPYQINGKTYHPAPDSTYDKIGDASWYGPGFHGKKTANGENFDQDDLTAAHPTLPMPSLVRVTNLKNKKSVVVRINDRGPFHANRIIDLSKAAAKKIDVMSVKPVRVQFLAKETEEYIASINGKSPKIDMVAYNDYYNDRAAKEADAALRENSYVTDNGEVQDFAPVQSVISNDIEVPVKVAKNDGINLISDAVADDGKIVQEQEILYKQAIGEPIKKKAEVQKTAVKEKPSTTNTGKEVVLNKPVEKKITKEVKNKSYSRIKEKFVILAGSFSSKENAQKLAESVGDRDVADVDNVNINGKEWWRVHIGPFYNKNKAEEALSIVQEKLAPDARIIRQN